LPSYVLEPIVQPVYSTTTNPSTTNTPLPPEPANPVPQPIYIKYEPSTTSIPKEEPNPIPVTEEPRTYGKVSSYF